MKRPEGAVLIAALLYRLANLLVLPLRPRARVRAMSLLMEWLDPRYVNHTKYGPIEFYCPATWPYSRSDMAKEPETNKWVESFDPSDVFWDIGANVGVFSLYAARRGLKVFAFEPAAINYFVLAKNVQINGFDDRITFLNAAIGKKSELGKLYMSNMIIGAAQHQFGRPQDESTPVKRGSYGRANTFAQSVMGFSIDEFIATYQPDFPTHIKVDVDGNEADIVEGARQTLRDPRLKSIMIEIRLDPRVDTIARELDAAGMKLVQTAGMDHFFRRP